MSSRIECAACGCPAAIKDGLEAPAWSCPMCGGGFVRFVMVEVFGDDATS